MKYKDMKKPVEIDCNKCVLYITNRCYGHEETRCVDYETYDQWDEWHCNIGEIE